jgi:hypothetical protein
VINVQHLRGTAAENAAYIGKEGELVVVTSPSWQLYVHDGVFPGGHLIGGNAAGGGGGSGLGFGSQFFYVSGTFVIQAQSIKMTILGGGGGGGGTNAGATPTPAGGGAGGAAIKYLSNLIIGGTLSVTVGLGGIGGGVANAGGVLGGLSSVASGTFPIATVSAAGGFPATSPTIPGTGGIGSGGDLNLQGNGGSSNIGGTSLLSPIGNGGSAALNGDVVNGVTIVAQNGAQGIVIIEW